MENTLAMIKQKIQETLVECEKIANAEGTSIQALHAHNANIMGWAMFDVAIDFNFIADEKD